MSNAETALAIANLINTYGPQIVSLVMRIKTDRGDEKTIDLLAEAGAQFDANIRQAEDALRGD